MGGAPLLIFLRGHMQKIPSLTQSKTIPLIKKCSSLEEFISFQDFFRKEMCSLEDKLDETSRLSCLKKEISETEKELTRAIFRLKNRMLELTKALIYIPHLAAKRYFP